MRSNLYTLFCRNVSPYISPSSVIVSHRALIYFLEKHKYKLFLVSKAPRKPNLFFWQNCHVENGTIKGSTIIKLSLLTLCLEKSHTHGNWLPSFRGKKNDVKRQKKLLKIAKNQRKSSPKRQASFLVAVVIEIFSRYNVRVYSLSFPMSVSWIVGPLVGKV